MTSPPQAPLDIHTGALHRGTCPPGGQHPSRRSSPRIHMFLDLSLDKIHTSQATPPSGSSVLKRDKK
ncbi:unnamed protein product [Gulo gulo]|uniref:Uncharacterized protein n=1 Tax=Gulo gulo TaxID=48420 RepID=A0A9X9LPF5_GULGU|nr:unnamed protein product [Gulo gulo]